MRYASDSKGRAIDTLKQIQEVLKRDGLPPHDTPDDNPIALYMLGSHNPDTFHITHYPEKKALGYRASGNTGLRYINYYIQDGCTKLIF